MLTFQQYEQMALQAALTYHYDAVKPIGSRNRCLCFIPYHKDQSFELCKEIIAITELGHLAWTTKTLLRQNKVFPPEAFRK